MSPSPPSLAAVRLLAQLCGQGPVFPKGHGAQSCGQRLGPFPTPRDRQWGCSSQAGPLTSFPRCCADLVSLRVYTSPHTEISRQAPGCDSSVKPPRGCITSTPLVVSPSMCPSGFFHLAAFSWGSGPRDRDVSLAAMQGHHGDTNTLLSALL